MESSIQRAVGALEALEKRLQKTANSQAAFNKLFGNTAQFDHFVDSVNKLGAVGATNFKLVADGLTQLASAVKSIPANTKAGNLTRDLAALTDALSKLKLTKTFNTNLTGFFTNFNDQLQIMIRLVASVGNSGSLASAFTGIGVAFTSIAKLAAAIPSVGKSGIVDVGKFVNELVTGVLAPVQATINTASLNTIGDFAKVLDATGGVFRSISRLVSLTPASGAGANIKLLIEQTINPLVELSNKPINTSNLQALSSTLSQTQKAIQLFISGTASIALPAKGPNLIQRLFGATPQAVDRDALKRFQSLQATLKGISVITNSLSSVAQGTTGLPQIRKLASSFSDIASGTRILINLADQLPADTRGRLARLLGLGNQFGTLNNSLKTIGFIARELSQIANNIPDVGNLNKLGNALEGVGRGIRILLDFSTQVADLGGFKSKFLGIFGSDSKLKQQLQNALKTIGFVAKELGKFSGEVEGLKSLGAVGNALANFGEFIKAINATNLADISPTKLQRLPLIGKIFGQSKFGQVGSFLKDVANAFKGFKGVSIPENLGGTLTALIEFAQSASRVDFKKIDLAGFGSFIKQVGEGLKNLSAVKIDAAKLGVFAQALTALQKLQGGFGGAGSGGSGGGSGIFQIAAGTLIGQLAYAALQKVQQFVTSLFTLGGRIQQALSRIGQNISNFGRNLQFLGQNLLRNFGLDRLAQSQIVQVAADFDHLSNAVKTFGGLTETELKSAQAFADEIGRKYPLSANDAMQATLDLIKAGQTLSQTQFIIPSAADLSALGDIDLHSATLAIIQATNAFDDFTDSEEASFENAAVAATQFSSAADVSTATAQELIEGLSNVGATANLAGLDLQQTLAILAEFNDAGLRGAEAGTQLAQVLNQINRPAAKDELAFLQSRVDKAGKDINLSLADANGNLRNFDAFIKSLASTYRELGFSQIQVLNSLTELTGAKSRQGVAILLQNNGFQQVVDSMNQMESAAVRSRQLLDDFRGDVRQLQGSLITLTKNGFLPLIRNIFRPFVQGLRRVADTLLLLPEGFFEFAGNVILTASAFATLAGSVLIAVGAVLRFEGVLLRVVGGVVGLLTHLPLTIAGLVGFAGSLVTLIGALTVIGALIGGVALAITAFRDVIVRNVGGAGDAFDRFVGVLREAESTAGVFLAQMGRALDLLFGAIVRGEASGFGQRVAEFFNRLAEGARNLYLNVLQIGAFFENFGNFIEAGFGGASAQRVAFFQDQLRKLASFPLIKAIFGQNATPAGLRRVFATLQKGVQQLRDALQGILSGGIGILFGEEGAAQKVHQGVSLLLKTVAQAIQKFTGLDLSESILNFDQNKIGAGVEVLLRAVLDRIRNWFVQHRYEIANAVGSLLSFGVTLPFNLASFILRVLGLDSAAATVQQVGDSIGDFITRAVNFAVRLLSGDIGISFDPGAMLSSLFTGSNFDIAVNRLADAIKNIVVSALGRVPQLLQDIGMSLGLQQLINLGITLEDSAAFQQIANALGNIAGYPLRAIGDVFTGIHDTIAVLQSGTVDTTVIVGIATALGALAINAGVLTTLFAALKGLLLGVALPAFGIVTLVSALGNIKELLEGDVGGFLSHTLADIASTVLSFFGVEMGRDTILDRVGQALTSLEPIVRQIGQQIMQELNALLANIALAIDDLRARIDILTHGNVSAGGEFFNIAGALQEASRTFIEPDTFGNLFKAFADTQFIDPQTLKSFGDANAHIILNAFTKTIGDQDVSAIPRELFDNIVKTLNDSGLMDRALETLSPDQKAIFTSRIATALIPTPEEIAPVIDENQTQIDAAALAIATQLNDAVIGAIAESESRPEKAKALPSLLLQLLENAGFTDLSNDEKIDLLNRVAAVASPLAQSTIQEVQKRIQETPTSLAIKTAVTVSADSIDVTPLTTALRSEIERQARLRIGVPIVVTSGASAFQKTTTAPTSQSGSAQDAFNRLAGRATGGDLQPYSAYGVHDTPHPEIAMFGDGTSLLLTGRAAGRMVKIVGMAGAPGFDLSGINLNNNLSSEALDADRDEYEKAQRKKESDANQKRIDKLLRQISDAWIEELEDQAKVQAKYRADQLQAEKDYNHQRGNLLTEGRESLLDAIRRGDGAAAQLAVRNTKKQLDELKYNYDEQNEQRKIQLEENLKALVAEREQKIEGYNEQLADLQEQNEEIAQEQEDADAVMLQQQKQTNARILSEETLTAFQRIFAMAANNQTITNLAAQSLNSISAIGAAFGAMIARAASAITGTGTGTTGIGSAIGAVASGIISGVASIVPPSNPSPNQVWKDPTGKYWYWGAHGWMPMPGRATGGDILPHSAYQIFDTPRDELMLTNDGRRLLLTGDNGGRIIPFPPNTNPPRSRDAGTQTINLSVDLGGISGVSDPAAAVELARQTLIPEIQRIVDRAASGNRSRTLLEVR